MSGRTPLLDARRLGPMPWRDLVPSLAGLVLGLALGAGLVGLDTVLSAQNAAMTGQVLLWGTLPLAGLLGAAAWFLSSRRDLLAIAACAVAATYPFLATTFQVWMLAPGLLLVAGTLVLRLPDRTRIALSPLLVPIVFQSVSILDPHPSQLAVSGIALGFGVAHLWGALAAQSPWRAIPYVLMVVLAALLAAAGLLGLKTAADNDSFGKGATLLLVAGIAGAWLVRRFWRTDLAARWQVQHLRVTLEPRAAS